MMHIEKPDTAIFIIPLIFSSSFFLNIIHYTIDQLHFFFSSFIFILLL